MSKTLLDAMLQLNIDRAEKLQLLVDLIFEKAVNEPDFSEAYAFMCRVLTDQFPHRPLNPGDKSSDGKAQGVTFRRTLLVKCQKEFEKESSDEKLLEEDRNKEFSSEEEKKVWIEELDYREMMSRKRMLGNIRFIGELFKLKMISENIMHDCIYNLFRSEKEESLEDQLECLCILLTTIGKDLDHPKAQFRRPLNPRDKTTDVKAQVVTFRKILLNKCQKEFEKESSDEKLLEEDRNKEFSSPRMEQYFQQINKIMEKKKISSRIKFALRDVIDLRSSGWVPRRDDGNPKTIDQIHREAQLIEKLEEIARQLNKLQRSSRGKDRVELNKSDNAWVRPSEKAKELPEVQRVMDELERNVRSILNKLTPQKFKTLVDAMLQLNIDSAEKLQLSIDLIFEKAVSEPGFSVAYANMCRVLTDQFRRPLNPGDKSSDGKAQVVTFRKILLNKCQKEFEKESSDEKLLEEDRNKEFSSEEEKKVWIEELDYRQMMNRKRMLGNIRFIGELFKLKMISENIMHDCIFKLLRSEKQESLEDQLECLCILLTTIGKDLDHPKALPRMEQYFQQINKIMEKKKISSRIKIALRDVIDLRSSGWVPRFDDGNPKTIDQIHREARLKKKLGEIARQKGKLQRGSRSRDKGRDSPAARGSSSASDGWTSVPSKTGRPIASAAVDISKFKITKKPDSSEISLGPGGRPGAWSRGASGGGSRSGSGSNTPTSDLEQKQSNRFDLLSESSVTPGLLDNKKGRGPPLRKSSASRSNEDRTAALKAVKDMTSGESSSRNQSPVRYSPEDMSSAPSSGQQTPMEKALSPVRFSEDRIRKITKSTLEEYFSTKDIKEASLCIKELHVPHLHVVFVEEAISVAIDKKPEQQRLAGALFHKMINEGILTLENMWQGYSSIVEVAPELSCDVPLIYKYLGVVIGHVIYDGTLSLNKLKETLKPLISLDKAGVVMVQALLVAVEIAGKEDLMSTLWSKSSITWDMLLKHSTNIQSFVKDNNVEFTLSPPSRSHASQIQDEMLSILQTREPNDEIFSLINSTVSVDEQRSPEFIHILTKSVCKSVIKDTPLCECDKEQLKSRSKLILKYIYGQKDLELQAIYALQELANDLNHPRGLLQILFEELYELDVLSEDTFSAWETSKDFPEGKGCAITSVKGFLQWLRKAEEEPNEDDIPQ